MTLAVRGKNALIGMLKTRRPAWSRSEKRWIKMWLEPLGLEQDRFGNLYKRIGETPVVWSSHTDTVHRQGGEQRLAITTDGRIMVHPDERQSNCLGADCTSGVWLMREMILAGKPGLYIFHRAEEIGGHGSRFIARDAQHLLDGIKWAIAFDRKGYTSVITHQGGRTASDKFAKALARELGDGFSKDDTGLFTDTANYEAIIPECTNVSIGYHRAHTALEWQDWGFLERLLDKVLALDVTQLPSVRDPNEVSWAAYDNGYMDDYTSGWSTGYGRQRTMVDLIRENPSEVAEFLEQWGVDEAELRQIIYSHGGAVRV